MIYTNFMNRVIWLLPFIIDTSILSLTNVASFLHDYGKHNHFFNYCLIITRLMLIALFGERIKKMVLITNSLCFYIPQDTYRVLCKPGIVVL